jgi:hypothetical protein
MCSMLAILRLCCLITVRHFHNLFSVINSDRYKIFILELCDTQVRPLVSEYYSVRFVSIESEVLLVYFYVPGYREITSNDNGHYSV